jgi:NAD(P)-dependent dehydrogenase (short-subunit alcohol dehydrogenase family)
MSRNAIVTGASGGIGRLVAQRARGGFTVILNRLFHANIPARM